MKKIKHLSEVDGLTKKKVEKDDGRVIVYYERTPDKEE